MMKSLVELKHMSHTFTANDVQATVRQIASQLPHLKLLVLFGSRARGNHRTESDWDFAVLYDQEMRKQYEKQGWSFGSELAIQQAFQLPDDKFDIIDLARCSDEFAHIVARDGQLLYERDPEEFANFRQKAFRSKAEIRQLEEEERALLERELRQWGV
jgi:uncharacterized protein